MDLLCCSNFFILQCCLLYFQLSTAPVGLTLIVAKGQLPIALDSAIARKSRTMALMDVLNAQNQRKNCGKKT